MAPLAALVATPRAYQPLVLEHGKAVDLGGFSAKVIASDQPIVDPSDRAALFTITIEVIEVADPRVVEWLGHPVARGAQITERVRIPLQAP